MKLTQYGVGVLGATGGPITYSRLLESSPLHELEKVLIVLLELVNLNWYIYCRRRNINSKASIAI
jgi:hypothetical protein